MSQAHCYWSKSLSDLFASSDQSLINLCMQATIPATFNTKVFLNHCQTTVQRPTVIPTVDVPFHLVLVHWTDAIATLSGLKSLLSVLKTGIGIEQIVEKRKILFVDWKVLEILNRRCRL